MTICVECAAEIPWEMKARLYCLFCNKKANKYIQVAHTYKIIDLLLLKDTIFRHFLINNTLNHSTLLILFILHVFSIISIRLARLNIRPLILYGAHTIQIDFYFSSTFVHLLIPIVYIVILKLCLWNISLPILIRCVLFSSFYNFFKMVFSLWKYSFVQYFIIVEALCCTGNIVALYCISKDFHRVFSIVFTAKILSTVLLIHIYELF